MEGETVGWVSALSLSLPLSLSLSDAAPSVVAAVPAVAADTDDCSSLANHGVWDRRRQYYSEAQPHSTERTSWSDPSASDKPANGSLVLGWVRGNLSRGWVGAAAAGGCNSALWGDVAP